MTSIEPSIEDLPSPNDTLQILHVFADRGVESDALASYGDVVRVGIDVISNESSQAIKADANHCPIRPDATFDLGFFQPPCGRWADMTSISGDASQFPQFISLSRELGEQYCDNYIIENKPRAPLQDPINLTGKMFGLPIVYERAFETSFTIDSTPSEADRVDTECSPYFYSDRSKSWWASVKGYTTEYPKQHLAKNCVPSSYIHFLTRHLLTSTNARDADYARSNHGDEKPLRIRDSR
jgi:hypothetical protein